MSAFPITPPKSLPEPHANLAVDRLVAKVQELRKEGLGMRPISQQTGVSLKTVWRLLQVKDAA